MSASSTFLKEFPKAVADDAAALFIGAGVSAGAGYPSWRELLKDIGEELGVKTSDVLDLTALAQWSISKSLGSKTGILKVIRDEIGVEHPVPRSLEIIARLPVRNIWTTNYDRLIERAFSALGRPIDAISGAADLAIRPRPGAARLYKMHGSIDRLDDIVISTDDYELYRSKRGAFLPLLQAHMTSLSMLFVGLSLTDPNVKHVLSMIRESFSANPPEHFAIVRPPHAGDYVNRDEFEARLIQHDFWSKDLQRYGLRVVEVENYDDVPALLQDVERRVASSRVWVSGSWPVDDAAAGTLGALAHALGKAVGLSGLSLVTGSGLTIMPAVTSGFLDSLQRSGAWDLERRLLVRPFPQAVGDAQPNREQWAALREEMARVSGAVVFIGGMKMVDGSIVIADGVFSERAAADQVGAFLLPVGHSGGAAAQIASDLIGSPVPASGRHARRPTDEELQTLISNSDQSDTINLVMAILKRFQNGRG